ncbi:ABC transporter permease [Paenibacillus physcomitrellae]|uniref:ABC transporter permease n=2 Tax=Paenibacillus physcomitrellae TaxID=1619311 RepID=A0ABQ1FSS3_9BACL|nr:ABC transporter permease [Paenibacillus physcomitrellae]
MIGTGLNEQAVLFTSWLASASDGMSLYDKLVHYQTEIWKSIGQTFEMVGISLLAAILLGLPVGTLLYLSRRGQMYENRTLSMVVNTLVNVVRSFPFLLLVVFLIPFTRLLVGTSIGTIAASVPLAIVAIAHYARLAEQSLLEIPRGVIEAARSMGSSRLQIIRKFLYPEARSGLVLGLTSSTISFISYSTVVGIVGGGGVGDFAIRYGYQRYEMDITVFIIILMIILVQAVQFAGSRLAAWLDKR